MYSRRNSVGGLSPPGKSPARRSSKTNLGDTFLPSSPTRTTPLVVGADTSPKKVHHTDLPSLVNSPGAYSRKNSFTAPTFLPDVPEIEPEPQYWKCPDDVVYGYMGSIHKDIPKSILDEPCSKIKIRGYTGHLPNARLICGEPVIPSEARQQMLVNRRRNPGMERRGSFRVDLERDNWRAFGDGMDRCERYEIAISKLISRGQSQEMLLRIVQAKISERSHSYSQQNIVVKKLFEAFDFNNDGTLDEREFRECLERCNIQFDDIQSLALYAYFDPDMTGAVEWIDFARHAMVFNPKGGTAVLPKAIIAKADTSEWEYVDMKV